MPEISQGRGGAAVGAGAASASGDGVAHRMGARGTGMMVEDGAAFVRNVTQVSLAAITVATKRFAETYNPLELMIIQQSMQTIEQSAEVFTKVSTAAGQVLTEFPS